MPPLDDHQIADPNLRLQAAGRPDADELPDATLHQFFERNDRRRLPDTGAADRHRMTVEAAIGERNSRFCPRGTTSF